MISMQIGRLPKFWLGLCICQCLLLFSACFASPATSSANWPIEGATPQRNRLTNEAITPPLTLATQFNVQGSTEYVSPVSIANNQLFADSDKKLHVLDLNNGKEQWMINLPGSFLSPTVSDGVVFVRVESGENGSLVALGTEKGKILWEHKFPKVGSQYDNVGGHVTAPVVMDGVVFVGASQTLLALDQTTGQLRWSFDTQTPIASSAALSDGTLYVTDFGGIYALDMKSGSQRWQFKHDLTTVLFAPILMDGHVYITGHDTVFALDAANGKVLWSRKFDGLRLVPAAATATKIFIKASNQLMALETATGKPLWLYEVLNFVSLPVLTTDYAYVVTRSDKGTRLNALRQSDGVEVWSSEPLNLANSAPIATGGAVYVRTVDGGILRFQSSQ